MHNILRKLKLGVPFVHILVGDTFDQYCHNPTNNPKQLKTTFVGVVLLSVRKKPPHHHHHHAGVITFKAVPGNLGS
jgi:hypothetical protein